MKAPPLVAAPFVRGRLNRPIDSRIYRGGGMIQPGRLPRSLPPTTTRDAHDPRASSASVYDDPPFDDRSILPTRRANLSRAWRFRELSDSPLDRDAIATALPRRGSSWCAVLIVSVALEECHPGACHRTFFCSVRFFSGSARFRDIIIEYVSRTR